MSLTALEKRVALLEKQVGAMLATQSTNHQTNDWRSLRGAFTGDAVMKQIFEEGRKIREAERKRARRQTGKPRRARS